MTNNAAENSDFRFLCGTVNVLDKQGGQAVVGGEAPLKGPFGLLGS